MVDHDVGGLESKGKVHVQSKINPPKSLNLLGGGGRFPGGSVVKNSPTSAGDMGSIPGPGRSHVARSN